MVRRYLVVLVFTLAASYGAPGQTVRTLRLTTADDVGISAAYYPVVRDDSPAILLLHGFATNRDEWGSFAPLLQLNGIATLAIDLRGHGESNRKLTAQGAELLDYRKFTPVDFQRMLNDVETAIDWLTDQPGIDKKRVGIAGSSLGANLALRYAMFNEDIAALLLLSPGIQYKEVRTDDAIQRIGAMPFHIVVSRNDPFAYASCQRLIEIRQEIGDPSATNNLIVCTGSFHGAPMLGRVKELPSLLANWLKQVLRPPVPSPAPEPPAKPATPAK